MPPYLPRLPLSFPSTAVAPAPPSRPHHPTVIVAFTAGTACVLSPGAAQPPVRCHPPSPPRPHNRDPDVPGSVCLTAMFLLKAHVASIYFECFRGMLQVFLMDVVKVDRNVAYVTIVVQVCCKGLLPMFHMCFLDACCKCVYLDVAYVSHIRCMCFIWMLRIVAIVFKCWQVFFFKFFISIFQVFHLPS
jgi:hypothetical protein